MRWSWLRFPAVAAGVSWLAYAMFRWTILPALPCSYRSWNTETASCLAHRLFGPVLLTRDSLAAIDLARSMTTSETLDRWGPFETRARLIVVTCVSALTIILLLFALLVRRMRTPSNPRI